MVTKTTDSFTLHLPKEVRSLNKTLKQHWSVRAKDLSEWEMLLRSELNKAKWDAKQFNPGGFLLDKKHITITRVMRPRQRPFDVDNLIGGCKSLVDSMKGILIKDDTAEYVEVKYKQVKGERSGTVITVRFNQWEAGHANK